MFGTYFINRTSCQMTVTIIGHYAFIVIVRLNPINLSITLTYNYKFSSSFVSKQERFLNSL